MDDEYVKSQNGENRFGNDFRRLEPVLPFAAVEHQLYTDDAENQRDDTDPVEILFPPLGFRQGRQYACKGEQTQRHVHEEQISPIVPFS